MNCAISALLLVLEVAPPALLEVEVLPGVELVVAVEAVELVAGGVEALLLDEVELLPHPVVSATVASASASTGSRRMSILLLPSIRPRSRHRRTSAWPPSLPAGRLGARRRISRCSGDRS
jgi:hypothetical protein